MTLRGVALSAVLLSLSACKTGAGEDSASRFTYTLYRTSSVTPNARIHVATFDAQVNETDEKNRAYNEDNCDTAQGLFNAQPRIKTRFFCELGRYRK